MSGALDRRTKLLYGLPEMPLQVATIPVVTFIPNYYGSELGVSLAAIGVVWMLARLFDGVSDPLIGYLSDRTASRWGRRRVWMVAALPIMMLALWKLFFPGGAVDAMYLLVWIQVPWQSWQLTKLCRGREPFFSTWLFAFPALVLLMLMAQWLMR